MKYLSIILIALWSLTTACAQPKKKADPVERWTALNHTIAVNKLLGYDNRVAMTNRPDHSPNARSNEQAYLFFEYFLKRD